MSSDWKTLTLNEIVDFGNGKARPKTEGNIPIYGGNGILGYSGDSNYQDETIIIGRVGAYCGATYFENNPIWVSDNALSATAKEGFIAKYAYYVLKSKNLNQYAQGSSHPLLTQGLLNKLDAYVTANKEIQKKIVSIIGDIEEKIAVNTQTNQTLEQIAQAIFKSWFVDFDPVKAKMNGEQPEGMDAATASLFPEKLVESKLGLIPEGWDASSMGEHFNITMGQSPKGETYNEDGEGIAFFQGRRDFGFRYPDVRVYTTDPKRYAKAGDTLISVRAPVGDKNMAAIDCCIGRGVAAIKHRSQSRSFTYAFVSHIEKKLGDSGSSGTVFSSINQNELKKVSFVAPPQELIEAFHKFVDPIDQKIEVLSGEIKSLSAMRDTLLPKLLSGEIELGSVATE
jgi:type I restriction enzyme, S subunit